ncbi:CMRF35-like molecule 3 [Arapaima gigas]
MECSATPMFSTVVCVYVCVFSVVPPSETEYFHSGDTTEDGKSESVSTQLQIDTHMAPRLLFIIITFTSIPGHDCVRTLETVTVQRGGSVTIPCLYDQEYKHHVKYWCRGGIWSSCSTMVRTDSPQTEGEVSITDHPDQLLFNVTMRNLQEKYSGWYWCAVEIGGLGTVDDSVSLYLSVTTGKTS